MRAGAREFLPKPLIKGDLVQALKKVKENISGSNSCSASPELRGPSRDRSVGVPRARLPLHEAPPHVHQLPAGTTPQGNQK